MWASSPRNLWCVAGATLMAALAACDPPKVSGGRGNTGTPVPGNPAPADAGGGPGTPPPGRPPVALPDAGPGPAMPPPPPGVGEGPRCAEEAHRAQMVPLDLLLLVDTSGSMNEMVATQTKWVMANNALQAFVKDPKSAGIGLGLQFFPYLTGGKMCTTDADCGRTGSRPNFWCHVSHVCVGPGNVIAQSCDPMVGFLCREKTCRPLGRCSQSGLDCLDIGRPCPAGVAGDMCTAQPRTCQNTDDAGSCVATAYEKLVVPIADLPGAAPGLTVALTSKSPIGGTPMGPAAEGALTHLRAHLAARPGRRAALVLVSDGLPQGCANDTVETVAGVLAAARAGAPAIPTYIIGVFDQAALNMSRASLDRLAMAGGTGMPFVVTTTADLTQRFLDALAQIRGTALACEFRIPAPTMGQIDFGKVNVRVNTAAGAEELIYVTTMDRCDPMRGGWYYDVNPATGTPTRVLMCPASCNRLKQAADQTVELRFGCRNSIIE